MGSKIDITLHFRTAVLCKPWPLVSVCADGFGGQDMLREDKGNTAGKAAIVICVGPVTVIAPASPTATRTDAP